MLKTNEARHTKITYSAIEQLCGRNPYLLSHVTSAENRFHFSRIVNDKVNGYIQDNLGLVTNNPSTKIFQHVGEQLIFTMVM